MFIIRVSDDEGAAAIRYGFGFGVTLGGILQQLVIQETAVVECLRNFIPFATPVKSFAQNMAACPKPQMVGYLLEYLVSFALVANYSGIDIANKIQVSQNPPNLYLDAALNGEVCFPDHMCGPDIIYRCEKSKTIYIVQVKFLKDISKQQVVNACDATDPDRFYCKRKRSGILNGFDDKRSRLLESLLFQKRKGYSLQQMLFIHTGGKNLCQQKMQLWLQSPVCRIFSTLLALEFGTSWILFGRSFNKLRCKSNPKQSFLC